MSNRRIASVFNQAELADKTLSKPLIIQQYQPASCSLFGMGKRRAICGVVLVKALSWGLVAHRSGETLRSEAIKH